MKRLSFLLALPLLCLFTGCGEPQADLSKPKTHQSGSVTFKYPKNWKVTDDTVTPDVHYIILETAGDAVVIFQSYPVDDAQALTDYAKAFAKKTVAELPIGEASKSTFKDLPEAHGYEWKGETYSLNLIGETVPFRRRYGTKTIGDKQVFLILQAATEDFSAVEKGFELVSESLKGEE